MPSRKQRRRREKLQRHEYEYVIETEEGEEIPIEKPAEPDKRDAKRPARATAQRGGREVPRPSLNRVLKRSAIFAPLILIIVWVFSPADVGTGARIFNAVALIAFFIPFSYLVDVFMYRLFSRRRQRGSGSG
jgi:hypothetical protein